MKREVKKGNLFVKTKEEKRSSLSSLWSSSGEWKERFATVSVDDDEKVDKASEFNVFKLRKGESESQIASIPISAETVIKKESSSGREIFFFDKMPDTLFGAKDKNER